MSDTPRTDALREVIIGQYKNDDLTGNGLGNILSALTDIETLESERDSECALADRLAEALKFIATDKIANANDMRFRANKALTAWKEARSE